VRSGAAGTELRALPSGLVLDGEPVAIDDGIVDELAECFLVSFTKRLPREFLQRIRRWRRFLTEPYGGNDQGQRGVKHFVCVGKLPAERDLRGGGGLGERLDRLRLYGESLRARRDPVELVAARHN